MNVTIAAMPQEFLSRAREGVDALGQPVRRLVARGGEPCRDALRRARAGERLILASFSPFAKPGPYHEFGPVFILENADGELPRLDRLPNAGGTSDYLQQQFVIRAYSSEEEIRDAALVRADELERAVERFLADSANAFLHVRFPTYGCFALRIDRATS